MKIRKHLLIPLIGFACLIIGAAVLYYRMNSNETSAKGTLSTARVITFCTNRGTTTAMALDFFVLRAVPTTRWLKGRKAFIIDSSGVRHTE